LTFRHITVGDKVTRSLAGSIPMHMRVTEVTDDLIVCGGWTFSRTTGAEQDDDLQWGDAYGRTGSTLVP